MFSRWTGRSGTETAAMAELQSSSEVVFILFFVRGLAQGEAWASWSEWVAGNSWFPPCGENRGRHWCICLLIINMFVWPGCQTHCLSVEAGGAAERRSNRAAESSPAAPEGFRTVSALDLHFCFLFFFLSLMCQLLFCPSWRLSHKHIGLTTAQFLCAPVSQYLLLKTSSL